MSHSNCLYCTVVCLSLVLHSYFVLSCNCVLSSLLCNCPPLSFFFGVLLARLLLLQLYVYSLVLPSFITTLQLYLYVCIYVPLYPLRKSSPLLTYPAHPIDPVVPPTADAGPDVHVFLPQHVVCINGSGSHDDFGIVKYEWNRSDNSPAAGVSWHDSELA